MADWKAKAIPAQEETKSDWKSRAVPEDYYNPVEKAGMAGLQALLSVPGVTPALEGYDKYVASPIRRTIQEGPVEAVKKIGEKAPGFKETLKEAGVSDVPLSEKIPSLFSSNPEEYKKPLTFKKGGLLDPSLAGVLGLTADVLTDPLTYVGLGTAEKGIQKVGEAALQGTKTATKATAEKALEIGAKAVPESVSAVATGVKEGTKEALGNLTGAFKTSVDPYATKAAEIAQKVGLNPAEVINPNIEFGSKSTAAKNYRSLMQSPGGDSMIQKFEAGKQKISDAVNNQVANIAKTTEFPKDAEMAGRLLKDSYDNAVNEFFNQRDVTFKTVQKMLPELNQVGLTEKQFQAVNAKLTSIRRAGNGLMNMGGTSELQGQGKILTSIADNMQANLSKKSFNQILRDAQSIGNTAYGTPNLAPQVKRAYKELYTTLSEGLVGTVDEIGRGPGRPGVNQIAESLKANNAAFHEFFNKQKFIDEILKNERSGGERLTQAFLNGDTKLMDDLFSVVKDDAVKKQLAGYLVDNALRDKNGLIQFGASRTALKNSDRLQRTLKRLVSPEELKQLDDVLELGEKYGIDLINPSGTSENTLYQNLKQSLMERPIRKGHQAYLESSARAGKPITAELGQPAPLLQLVQGGAPSVPQVQNPSLMEFLNKIKNKTPIGVYRKGIESGGQQ